MALFKGYFQTKNKKPLVKWTKEYEDSPNENWCEYAGIVSDNTICIDCDDHDNSRLLYKIVVGEELNCKVIKTTRGMHFYFKGSSKCCTASNMACGIQTDIKANGKGYCILKYDNKPRPVIYDTVEYDEIPKYFKIVNHSMDFVKMSAGDGRNSALFGYILTLQREGFTKKDIKECLGIINKYVFSEPLSDSEFETITRQDAFKKEAFFIKKEFLHDKFAEYIQNEFNVKKINSQLFVYSDGAYIADTRKIERAMIRTIPCIKERQRHEALSYLNIMLEGQEIFNDERYVCFNNGLLNLETMQMQPHSPDFLVTNKINRNYKEDAYYEPLDNTLNKLCCKDMQVRALVEEMVGYCMYRRNELGKSFILVGNKSNGKSTFLSLLRGMLGEKNVSSLDISELSDRFNTIMLSGMLANIGDDISDDFLRGRDISIFKKLVTGDSVKVEQKGKDPINIESYAKLIFSANQIPHLKDPTGAVMRRLVVVPFKATFSKDDADFDPWIKKKLQTQECYEYLIKLGIEGLQRVLKNRAFTEPRTAIKALKEYEAENNPVHAFKEHIGDASGLTVAEVYLSYQTFCDEQGVFPLSKIKFGKEFKLATGLESVLQTRDGVCAQRYV